MKRKQGRVKKEKVILAYSGGLDTSVILKWLDLKGFDVICFVGNVGQTEDFAAVEAKAYATGASKVYTMDLRGTDRHRQQRGGQICEPWIYGKRQ